MSKLLSLFTGNIVVRLLMESMLALVMKIAWAEVIERLLMRLVKRSLRRLAAMTTNDVDDKLVEDVIAGLEQRQLPKVD